MNTQEIKVGSSVTVTGGTEYHFQKVGTVGVVDGKISGLHLSVRFGGSLFVVLKEHLTCSLEEKDTTKQLQELLKEAIQHIQSISALYKTQLVFNSDHETFYKEIRLSEDFADRALPFATLEVKPND